MQNDVLVGRASTIVGSVIALAYILTLVQICRRRLAHGKAPPAIRLHEVISVNTGGQMPTLGLVDVEKEARAAAQKLRIETIGNLLKIGMHISGAFLIISLLRRNLTGVWDDDYNGVQFSREGILFPTVLLFAALILQVAPWCLTEHFGRCFHILCMSVLIAKTLSTDSASLLLFQRGTTTTLRMAMGFLFGNVLCTSLLNLTFSAANIWVYLVPDNCDVCELLPGDHRIWFLWHEVLITIVASVICYGMESRGLAASRAQVKEKFSSQAVRTINILLTALCDAVVHLDRDYQVLLGLEKLQALLLKQPVAGLCFLDALTERDKASFVDECSAPCKCDGTTIAPSLHAEMRDASGSLIKVQLFITRFPDVGDAYEYIIGVRELSREEAEEITCSTGSFTGTRSGSITNGQEDLASWVRLCQLGDDDEMIAVFDPMTWKIHQATPSFTAIGGPSTIGSNISDWVHDHQEFRVYVQRLVNQLMNGSNKEESDDYGWLTLKPPVATRSHIEYWARCEIQASVCDSIEDASADEVFVARAILTDMTVRRCRDKMQRRRRRSSSSPSRQHSSTGHVMLAL